VIAHRLSTVIDADEILVLDWCWITGGQIIERGQVRETVESRAAALRHSGELERRRAAQAREVLWTELGEGLILALKRDKAVAGLLPALEAEVAARKITPSAAARRGLAAFAGAKGTSRPA
jgi:hypothetical protein